MARSHLNALTVDMTVVHTLLVRLRARQLPVAFWRHLGALLADQCAIEMHDPMPGSGYDVRAVPSIQCVRLLAAHGIFE